MKFKSIHKAGLLLLVLIFGFQNCGEGFQANLSSDFSSISQNEVPSEILEPVNIPEYLKYIQPNFIDDCAINPEYNACIFWKNPVVHANQTFPTNINLDTPLEQYQTHAINILGTDNSGLLRNPTINVVSQVGARVNSPDLDFKRSYNTEPSEVVQLMVYHWMQSLVTLMKERTGTFYAENQNVQVIAISNVENRARYTTSNNTIELGRVPAGTHFGLDGEIAAHELGHANHRHAGFNFQSSGTQACPAAIGGTCCANRNTGCSVALSEGSADFMYTLLFPTSTRGGETITNDLNGPARCGLERNAGGHRDLTLNNIPCDNAHMLGMIYASIWWEIRAQAEADEPGMGAQKIETLFSETLMVIARDTWASAFNKITTLDNEMYNGQYSNLFRAEFERRGITLP